MIKSDVKKKIEANATITNTMIVVMVVSRRLGQVTLAVSERTSCRNLNGLKAIVGVIRVVRRLLCSEIRTALRRPALFPKDEPPGRARCFRGIQSRAGYPPKRAGSRWAVCTADPAKGQGSG